MPAAPSLLSVPPLWNNPQPGKPGDIVDGKAPRRGLGTGMCDNLLPLPALSSKRWHHVRLGRPGHPPLSQDAKPRRVNLGHKALTSLGLALGPGSSPGLGGEGLAPGPRARLLQGTAGIRGAAGGGAGREGQGAKVIRMRAAATMHPSNLHISTKG